MQVQRDAEPVFVPGGAHPLHRQAVAKQEMVGGREGGGAVFASRRVDAQSVAHPGGDPGLVQGDPEPYLVRQRLVDDARVICEAFARLPVRPAAPLLERLRQVPVVEGEHRFYGATSETFDQPSVEIQASLIDATISVWLYAGPGHGEAVS